MSGAVLFGVTGAGFALALVAPLLARWLRARTGYVLAVAFAAGLAGLLSLAPRVIAGDPVEATITWLPSLGIDLTLLLDGVGLLFSVLILGVGALVMAYSASYLKPDEPCGRFYGFLTLFAASMLGLVVSGDAIVMVVFWELTSVVSFFLIGGTGAGRAQATRAFLTTALGGLALLAGVILMGVAAGTTSITGLLDQSEVLRASSLAPAIVILLLLGAFTKSAQVPFHFWLPGAMVAPTPISTYLHAATMVKAGIFVLMRFSPIFAGEAIWLYPIVVTGLVTAIYGAVVALKQDDLKALLAYGTVSALGFMTALVGLGTFAALAAASVTIVAHAAYKATLFMVVGIVDHETGSRDIRQLSGLRRTMPWTAATAAVATVSMMGLPPLLGFISKEEVFSAFIPHEGGPSIAPLFAVAAVVAAIATFAYGLRFFAGTFAGPPVQRVHDPKTAFLFPAILASLAGLTLGGVAGWLDPFIERVAIDSSGAEGAVHLGLWHGFRAPLWMSVATVATGLALYALRRPVGALLGRPRQASVGDRSFDRVHKGVIRTGYRLGEPFLVTVPAFHIGLVLATAAALGVGAWVYHRGTFGPAGPIGEPHDWVIATLIAGAAVVAVTARERIAAVALLGTAGFLVAALYATLGAPDLAITQLLIETLTVVLAVLVFRRLPRTFRTVGRARRRLAAVAAVGVGTLATLGTFAITGRRPLSEVGAYYLGAAETETGGSNVVNTILVDFRALDTLGEITVLAVAAIGVAAMVRMARR